MNLPPHSTAVILAACCVWASPLQADVTESKAPKVATEREFVRPKPRAADYLASPFYIPKSIAQALLFPVERVTGFVFDKEVPERIVDVFSDDTKRIWFIPTASIATNDGATVSGTFKYNNIQYDKKNLQLRGSIQLSLDRSASAFYEQESTPARPLYYRVAFKYKSNSDAYYYGTGIDSSNDDKSAYSHEYYHTALHLGYQLPEIPHLTLFGVAGFEFSATAPGRADDNPSVETLFGPDELIGFRQSIGWIRYGLGARFDSQLPTGHPHRGWLAYIEADRYEDPDLRYSHTVFRSGLSTLINLYRKVNVLALGAHIESTDKRRTGEVPFYRLPSLDDRSPLRGFPGGRFRDNRNIVGNLEYRFYIWQDIDPEPYFALGTLFFDLGKPFNDMESLASGGVLYSVGGGMVVATRARFIGRAQLAWGGEGVVTNFTVSRAF